MAEIPYNALYQEKEDGVYFQCGEHWVHESLVDIIYSFKEEVTYGND